MNTNKTFCYSVCAIAGLACASGQVSFVSHYIGLGTQDSSVAIAADAAGDIFIVSAIGPLNSPSIRVTKTDPNGEVLAVMNFAPGVKPAGAAADPQGNLFVTGNGLVAKLDNGLTSLLAMTSIAAANATAVTTDASGNVWVTGSAGADFPTTAGAYQSNPAPGATYAFVAELSSDLGTILRATLFGSSLADCNQIYDTCRHAGGGGIAASTMATSIAIDPSGAIAIAGYTNGLPAPLDTQPYSYGFVAKFSADLSTLAGEAVCNPVGAIAGQVYFRAMALDAQGNVVVTGSAGEVGPIPGGTVQPNPPSGGGGIVLKYDGALQNQLWGTFFGAGGLGTDQVQGVAIDSQGNVWLTGLSQLNALPNATSTSNANLPFVAELTSDGTQILNLVSSQFGGAAVTTTPAGVAIMGLTDSFLLTGLPDQPSLLMVANAANSQSSGTIAPIELISLYGADIGPPSPLGGVVAGGAFTNNLGGYQVLFNGIPAPLLYAGPNQINLVAPAAIANQQTVSIQVVGPGGTTIFPTVFVGAASPQIFSQMQSYTLPSSPGTVQTAAFAIATNQDGTMNSQSNPAPEGSIVTIWATGTGLAGDPLPDGSIGTSATMVSLPIVMTGIQVSYAGQAPGAIQGLTQINFQVPNKPFVFGPTPAQISFQQNGSMSGVAYIEITAP